MPDTSIMQLLIDGNPSQPTTTNIIEYMNTGKMFIDLQTGTVVHQFLINGDTGEAELSAGGLGWGVAHPWETKKGYYLTNVDLEPYVQQNETDKRRTLVTVTFRKRPCPGMYEEEAIGALISHQTWWDLSGTTPKILNGVMGVSVLHPSILLKRRYLRVTGWSYTHIDALEEHLRKRNGVTFAGTGNIGQWLFREARRRLLYGDPVTGTDAAWEFSLTFLKDPYRSHAYWSPKKDAGGRLIPPVWNAGNQEWDMEPAFHMRHFYDKDDDGLDWQTGLISYDISNCAQSALSA